MNQKTQLPKANKTRNDIIQATEKLFAAKGFQAMTLRDVTRDARVNLAAVNYHFGSKQNLMLAVIRNRFEPINEERIRRLEALSDDFHPNPIPLEAIFDALFQPLFEAAAKDDASDVILIQMIGRAITEPADFLCAMHKEFFAELTRRFMIEIKRSCSTLSDEQLEYRFFFAISTMIGTIVEKNRLERISGGKLDSPNLDRTVRELTAFVVSGFLQSDSTA